MRVYIARTNREGKNHFSIRESFLKDGVYHSRDLADLGHDPRIFVRYPQGRSFYIDGAVEEALQKTVKRVDYDMLERVFWPFVKPEVRRRYAQARSRDHHATDDDMSGVHVFDKRRLSFLRTGSMNQRRIEDAPDKLFRSLTRKSRDELEQRFMADENRLSPREIKSYVYVIFDIQRHFNSLAAREMPQALDQDRVEQHVLDDLCILNTDKPFWSGMTMQPFLHDYLVRYLIMFFDSDYEKPRLFEDLEFAAFNRRRYFRQTERPIEEAYTEGGTLFGVPVSELKTMGKREIQRLYRKKAREFHPDHGGEHEAFIDLTRVYEELMMRRGKE